MKRSILISIAAAMLLAACGTNYVVTDSVSRRLDGTRTIFTDDSVSLSECVYGQWPRTTLAPPMPYDFRVMRDTMLYAYSGPLSRGEWTVNVDSLSRMMSPEVSVNRYFRWFTTRYCYTACFRQLDSLTVPISKYMTEDEQRLYFYSNELPADWNGADLYSLLDDLNTKYVKWWSHSFFEKEYEVYCHYADSNQRALLAQYHDTLLALILADLPDNQESFEKKARLFPALDFVGRDLSQYDVQMTVLAWFDKCWDGETRVLWRVELPGGRTAEYMVSAERLIMGDYTVSLSSRVVNWWAVVLTFLVAAVPLVLVFHPKRRIR